MHVFPVLSLSFTGTVEMKDLVFQSLQTPGDTFFVVQKSINCFIGMFS